MKTAEKLYNTLVNFVAMNEAFDIKNGEPDETVLKTRAANYGLIRTAVIASDFISNKKLDKAYWKFVEAVDKDLAKIVVRNKENE